MSKFNTIEEAIDAYKNGEILIVVDDEDLARENVRETLVDAGYEAIEAGNLKKAHKYIDEGAADIVLLDVMLEVLYAFWV